MDLPTEIEFLREMPKIELHVHIEGTMTPSLRWKLSLRNRLPLTKGFDRIPIRTEEELVDAYERIRGRIGATNAGAARNFTFREVYYDGFELLQTEDDYYDLAMDYFRKAAEMRITYCEIFFDVQGHTERGIPIGVIMEGFRKAKEYAQRSLLVHSQWIMCFLRDRSPESAMIAYRAALPYRSIIVGVGLDSNEFDRPPSLFSDLFLQARHDGFKITSHCDFNQKDNLEHIRQVAGVIGGGGADRIDHGLNAADSDALLAIIKARNIGLTICPCAYVRHTPKQEIVARMKILLDAGINVSIASDDPAYMKNKWLIDNLQWVRDECDMTTAELVQFQKNALDMCWADVGFKFLLLSKILSWQRDYARYITMSAMALE